MLEFNPGSVIANYHLGVDYSSMGEYEKAIDHFKQLSEGSQEDEAVLFHMGVAYFESGQWSEAIKYLKKSVEKHPEHKRAQKMLDRLLEADDI